LSVRPELFSGAFEIRKAGGGRLAFHCIFYLVQAPNHV